MRINSIGKIIPEYIAIRMGAFGKAKLRNVEELWSKLGELCEVFSPEECKNYFTHAGYKKSTRVQTIS